MITNSLGTFIVAYLSSDTYNCYHRMPLEFVNFFVKNHLSLLPFAINQHCDSGHVMRQPGLCWYMFNFNMAVWQQHRVYNFVTRLTIMTLIFWPISGVASGSSRRYRCIQPTPLPTRMTKSCTPMNLENIPNQSRGATN